MKDNSFLTRDDLTNWVNKNRVEVKGICYDGRYWILFYNDFIAIKNDVDEALEYGMKDYKNLNK